MTDPKQLTEETPESPQDLSDRGLILASSGEVRTGSGKQLLTEDLPQEEDEQPGSQILES